VDRLGIDLAELRRLHEALRGVIAAVTAAPATDPATRGSSAAEEVA
jgi:hypothetical protein